MTLTWVSYLHQLQRNFQSSNLCWRMESIRNEMPLLANLWKHYLIWGWPPLLLMLSCRVFSMAPFTFFLLYLLCLYLYSLTFVIKHFISLLPETSPRDWFWSGLQKTFPTTQSHSWDFSQLSWYKTNYSDKLFFFFFSLNYITWTS